MKQLTTIDRVCNDALRINCALKIMMTESSSVSMMTLDLEGNMNIRFILHNMVLELEFFKDKKILVVLEQMKRTWGT